jgi:predicted DNA-binding transcriptional regulator AlpA
MSALPRYHDLLAGLTAIEMSRASTQKMRADAMAQPNDPLLTTAQAAGFLKVAERTLQRWRREGTGPKPVRRGGRIYYWLSDLEGWVEEY